MAPPIVTHIIGAVVMVSIILAVMNYSLITYNTTRYNNLSQLYEDIAQRIALSISNALMDAVIKGVNNTLIQLVNPVESASGEGYNVYIGNGTELSKLFPRIPNDSRVYVVVSTPDRSIYGYATVADLNVNIAFAKGRFIVDKYRTGFDVGEGYVEGGVPFLCRLPIYVKNQVGVNLSDYIVLINLSYSDIVCNYLNKIFTPTRSDVRFTDSDGVTRLDYYIEYWNESAKKALIWVKIPRIGAYESKTIYMYWGNPYATEQSDPGIFPLLDNLGGYSDLTSLLDSGRWGVKYGNVSTLLVSGNGSALTIAATYSNSPGYVNIYSLSTYNTTGQQGWIVEDVGQPVYTGKNSQNYRIGFYMWNESLRNYRITLIPPVIDPTLNLTPYTIVYGNWSIIRDPDSQSNLVLNNTAIQTMIIGKNNISIAVAQRPINSSSGDYVSVLYKVKVYWDNVYRGIVYSDKPVNESTQAFAVLLVANATGSLSVCTLDVNELLQNGKLDMSCDDVGSLNGEDWFYINTTIRNPGGQGQGNPQIDIYVYKPDGTIVWSRSSQGTRGLPGRPNYIGPIVFYDGGLPSYAGSLFDDLIAIRSDNPVDVTKVVVKGLSANWSIELYDVVYDNDTGVPLLIPIDTATADSSGVAVLNVSTRPILGVNGWVELHVYDSNGNLIDVIKIDQLISGGTIIEYSPGLEASTSSFSAMIHGSGNSIGSCNVNGQYVYLLSQGASSLNTICTSVNWGRYLTGVGFYNNAFYYFIYTADPYMKLVNSSKIGLVSSTSPLVMRVVFGVSLEGEYSGNAGNINTTGSFEKIRVRPFVYPEPNASYNPTSVETASFPKPPEVAIDEYTGVIVFSSKLMIDIAIKITAPSSIVIVEVPKGVRSY